MFAVLTAVTISLFRRRQKTAYTEMITGTCPGTTAYCQTSTNWRHHTATLPQYLVMHFPALFWTPG